MSDFFFQIVLFIVGALVGVAVPLLPKGGQKTTAIVLAMLLIIVSLIWVGYEMGIRESKPTAVADVTSPTSAPTPTANQPYPPATTESSSIPEPTLLSTSSPTLGYTWSRPTDGMVMVYVPAGQFEMGSTNGESDEQPVHTVTLDEFWIDQTEVTVAQFQGFVTETGYKTEAEREGWGYTWTETGWEQASGASWQHPQGPGSNAQDNHPVVQVSWNDALAYCKWAGGRLPTEAEWEYAARGPKRHVTLLKKVGFDSLMRA